MSGEAGQDQVLLDRAPVDRAAFIRANTRLSSPALVPEVRLHLADEAVALWMQTEAALQATGLPPPFWAFAWAGGQALARYIGDWPETVAGRRVLDFASGSGLVAIAAARAGAARVEASEIDAFACAAIALNGAENGVAVETVNDDMIGRDLGWDVVLAGDVAYERDMAEAATDWLEGLARRGALVLIGDPRRSYLALGRLDCIAEYSAAVPRTIEDADVKRTGVYVFRAARRPAERDSGPRKSPARSPTALTTLAEL
jgi:predicted nicotinamide N-methyase